MLKSVIKVNYDSSGKHTEKKTVKSYKTPHAQEFTFKLFFL